VHSYCALVLRPAASAKEQASLEFGTRALDFFLDKTSQSNEQIRSLQVDIGKKRDEIAAVNAQLQAFGWFVVANGPLLVVFSL
jgi:hypothetical protein